MNSSSPRHNTRIRNHFPENDQLQPQVREYQEYILRRLDQLRASGKNAIVELDCGLGKRFLMWKLLEHSDRTLILLDSTSSLVETEQYMKSFGSTARNIDVLSSRTPSYIRTRILASSTKHVLAMPQTLFNSLKRNSEDLLQRFQVIIINEVDKLVRRTSQGAILRIPWNRLFRLFTRDQFIIGMSGTLRDDHVYFKDPAQLKIRKELETLQEVFPRAELITMEEYYSTDIEQYIQKTLLHIVEVDDPAVQEVAAVLSLKLDELTKAMIQDLKENEPEFYHQLKSSTRLLTHLPVREDLKAQYASFALLRKYLYAMPPSKFAIHAKQANLPLPAYLKSPPAKVQKIVQLVRSKKKSVVLCSYLTTIQLLQRELESQGISTIIMTGKTPAYKRKEIITQFKTSPHQLVFLISPVGERDLDLPDADLLIIYDLVNSVKTVYQKIKRTRGGDVVLLCYAGTSEVKKTWRVVKNILQRYSWSTELASSSEMAENAE